MEIFHRPPTATGPAATFTGDVWIDGVYPGPGPEPARRFAPSARSHWHSNRLGRVLHVLYGIALLGRRNGSVIEAHPGNTICTAPGEEHWHGAAPEYSMAHLADYQAQRTPAR
jgi:quercetin dioxygenase-like cupin family protein